MKPASPVVYGHKGMEVVAAKYQHEYLPLPVLIKRDSIGQVESVMSRWELDQSERQQIAQGADVFVESLTRGDNIQPIKVRVMSRYVDPKVIEEEGY
jgi:hypothetical protein